MKKSSLLISLLALVVGSSLLIGINKTNVVKADTITYFDKVITSSSDLSGWELVDMEVGNSVETFVGLYPNSEKTYGTATYLVNATTGNYLDTLVFGVYGNEGVGRFAYYFGDFGVKAEISISTDNINYQVAAFKNATGNAITTFDLDLTDYVTGKKYTSLYVKLYLGTTADGCGYDTSWTTLSGIKITGNEVSSEDKKTEHDYIVSDFFGGDGSHGSSTPYSNNATETVGLCGDGNEVYGAIVGDAWGASIETAENQSGYVKYKIGKPSQIITALNLNAKFTFSGRGLDDSYNGDRIYISVSLDDVNYDIVAQYSHNNEQGYIQYNSEDKLNVNLDLAEYLSTNNREQYIYVKFQMTHLLALSNRELAYIGMCLHESKVTYSTKNCLTISYNPNGGQLPEETKEAFFNTDDVYTLPVLVRTGYKFLGWFNAGDEQVITFNPANNVSISVTAKWEINDGTYSITYIDELNADNPNPETFNAENPVTLVNLTKDGYEFVGWFDALESGNKVEVVSTDTYNSDVTLYAIWSENSYNINYVVDDNATLVADGFDALPTSVKYSETINMVVTLNGGVALKYITINGEYITLFESGFQVKGVNMVDINIVIACDELNHTLNKTLNENFGSYAYGNHSYLENVYSSENARIIHDSDNNAGLSISSGEAATLVYKFQASQRAHFDTIEIGGSARLFDFNGNAVKLEVFTSVDGGDCRLLKQYVASNPYSGDEYVDLSYSKVINDTDTLFVKFVLTGAANMDWAVIRSLTIDLNEENNPVVAPTTNTTYTLTFDKYIPEDVSMNVDLKGEEITSVKIDKYSLTASNYSINENTLTIKSEVLMNLANGKHIISLTTAGGSVSWNLDVKDTTPHTDTSDESGESSDTGTSNNGDGQTESKKGCSGSIVAISSIVSLLSLCGLTFAFSKKER